MGVLCPSVRPWNGYAAPTPHDDAGNAAAAPLSSTGLCASHAAGCGPHEPARESSAGADLCSSAWDTVGEILLGRQMEDLRSGGGWRKRAHIHLVSDRFETWDIRPADMPTHS